MAQEQGSREVVARALGALLSEFPFPTRMVTVLERRGLRTVRELAELPASELLAEGNLGRKSVRDTQSLVEARFGVSWEELVRAAGPQEPATARASVSWDDLGPLLPPALASRSLRDLEGLPTRMRGLAERRGLSTVAELAGLRLEALRAEPNMGRKSIADTFELLLALLREELVFEPTGEAPAEDPHLEVRPSAAPEEPTLSRWPDAAAWWRARLAPLAAADRLVLTKRAGFQCEAVTLRELGELLGVTRERVRQLEGRGLKMLRRHEPDLRELESRLARCLAAGALPLERVAAEDPWLAPLASAPAWLAFVLERLLEERLHLFVFDGQLLLSVVSQETLAKAERQLDAALQALAWPRPYAEVAALAQAHTEALGSALQGALRARVEGLLLRSSEDPAVVLGYGARRRDELRAWLRASPASGVTVAELAERFGRGHMPEELVFLERGRVTLSEKLEGFEEWAPRVGALCAEWMREHGPERQWSCHELAEVVRASGPAPPWFGPYPLGALLERSGRVRYLGRFVVVLPEVEGERTHLRELVRQLLEEHGEPLKAAALRAQVAQRRGCSELTFTQLLLRAPFVEVREGYWGLLSRDVPGGAPALERAVTLLAELLAARGAGLAFHDALARLRSHDESYERWSIPMLRSVCRQDSSLLTSVQGAVGLAEWDGVRLPGRAELLERALREGGGRCSLSALLARIEALYDEAPSRNSLLWMAWRAGASLQGDELALRSGEALPMPELPLTGIPANAAQTFARLCEEPEEDPATLAPEVDEHMRRLYREAVTNEGIDLAQVLRLQRACHAMLARWPAASREQRRWIQAATRYFVLSEDGASDFVLGGLDDDEAVSDAVFAALDAKVPRAQP